MSLLQKRRNYVSSPELGVSTAFIQLCSLTVAFLFVFSAIPTLAQPSLFSTTLELDELERPIAAGVIPGSEDLYVVHEDGLILKFEYPSKTKSVLLDLKDSLVYRGAQRLYSVALHPKFAENERVFVTFLDTRLRTRLMLAEFKAGIRKKVERALSPEEQLAKSRGIAPKELVTEEEETLDYETLAVEVSGEERLGGQLAFDRDGYLLLALGDGSLPHKAQQTNSKLGALLRIAVDEGRPYTVPDSNPFEPGSNSAAEILAYGFRYPRGLAVHPQTGLPWLVDQGEEAWHEVNEVKPGKNYAWDVFEGESCLRTRFECIGSYEHPLHKVKFSKDSGLVGGVFARGGVLNGAFLYIDAGTSSLWSLRRASTGTAVGVMLADNLSFKPSALALGPGNSVLLVATEAGAIYRLQAK